MPTNRAYRLRAMAVSVEGHEGRRTEGLGKSDDQDGYGEGCDQAGGRREGVDVEGEGGRRGCEAGAAQPGQEGILLATRRRRRSARANDLAAGAPIDERRRPGHVPGASCCCVMFSTAPTRREPHRLRRAALDGAGSTRRTGGLRTDDAVK